MQVAKNLILQIRLWFAKDWLQWAVAVLFFFLMSWLFMGGAINRCSTTSTAMGSDSTGGFAWDQWATGNHLSWGYEAKSNYPYGETLGRPQFITSSIFIGIYKILASLTTPICGINLMALLGFMTTALLAFGVVKWLLKRFAIAIFAGFAAAYVPFHQLKAESHINYIWGSFFIAAIWAYLWFISRPSHKRAMVLGAVCSLGFYFDGYFVLISSVVIASLFSSSFILDLLRIITHKQKNKDILKKARTRLKYLLIATGVLALLLTPILLVYRNNSAAISQSLAAVRSDIKTETITYGARPIEFIVPSSNSALIPNEVPWTIKPHGSNASEDTLYIGYTIIVLIAVALVRLFYRKDRTHKLREMSYGDLVWTLSLVIVACFVMSLPAVITIFGYRLPTPTYILIKLTSNWRVLSRMFLALHPAAVIVASLGLYMLIRRRSTILQLIIVTVCGIALFLEYLPAPLHPTGDLYKDAPPIYQRLRTDSQVKLVAEYPLAGILYTPEIFTYQQMHNKELLNANDVSISRGQLQGSIAGLADEQTLAALKELKVDVLITHGLGKMQNPDLNDYYVTKPSLNLDGTINLPATMYSYRISNNVVPRRSLLTLKNGYESLSVDDNQKSHRFITKDSDMTILNLETMPAKQRYSSSFKIASACPTSAFVTVSQAGKMLWDGKVTSSPTTVNLTVSQDYLHIRTAYCAIDVTDMSANPAQ
jgi:hypothetical protein